MSFGLFLTEPYFQRVLLTAVLVAGTAAVLGVFLVLRGQSLFGDGVAHISFAGIALGFVLGWFPLGTALAGSLVGALLIHELHRRGITKSDTAIGIVFTASLAFGIVLVSRGAGVPPGVESYLFGNLLLVSDLDFRLVLVAAAVLALLMGLLGRPFLVMTFDEEAAAVQGLPVRLLGIAFTLLTAATIVIVARVVGVLLVSALLIIPAATALQFARSFRVALVLSAATSVLATLLGLAVSSSLDLAAGATIALASAALFFLAVLACRVRLRLRV